MNHELTARHWQADLRASLVVFLVALPLALGIAVASGYPPVAGLIASVVGGLIVGFLGGAPLQVSGAAAGLAVIVFDNLQRFGYEKMAVIVALAGLMQVVAGFLRTGTWFQAVSPAVLRGMLAGIGILIVASQLHVMMDRAPMGGGLEQMASLPTALWETLAAGDAEGNAAALLVGILTIAVMLVFPRFVKASFMPPHLAAILLACAVAYFFGLDVSYVTIPDDLFGQDLAASFLSTAVLMEPAIWIAAVQIALIASIESLLCAAAVDQMHDGARSRFDRELSAQGVGNLICGLLSALPITGVIVRSSANLQAGGKTRLSAILHGVWLLCFIVLLPDLLGLIPTAALAGLLVYTGFKLVDLKAVESLARFGKAEVFIYGATVTTIVAVDLLSGVMTGLALAGLRLFWTLTKLSIDCESCQDEGKVKLKLTGAATFLMLPRLAIALENLPKGAAVVLESDDLRHVDSACMQHLGRWKERHERLGGSVELDGKLVHT